jgi:superfamily I DNA/RNA helicase
MPHTSEQLAIFAALAADPRRSQVIEARAGSGKTSTLMDALPNLGGDTLFMAYNRAIADEIRAKASSRYGLMVMATTAISTVHSHGLKAFNASGMRAKTLSGKLSFMLDDLAKQRLSKDDDLWRNLGKVRQLTSMAKAFGFGLTSAAEEFPSIEDQNAWLQLADHFMLEEELVGDTQIEEVVEWAQTLLKHSNARVNSIDFDDMIYLPLLMNLNIPTYDNVLLDEAQDINATRRELAFRSVKPTGRLIAVGDPYQAIYGFTGADTASLDKIQHRSRANVLPLTICWRCDAAIIAEAQKQVPDIQPRPGAPDGQVLTIDFEEDKFLDLPQAGDAILCRLNKPNVAVCLGLLRRGTRAKIEGRDLGNRLDYHLQRATSLYAHQPLVDSLLDLDTYEETEVGKLVARNKSESTIALLEDEIDATRLIMERCIETSSDASYPAFQALLGELFGDDVRGCVVLSSVHKAKGREWPRVFLLGYNDYMPFSMAKSEWEQEQEQNLIYVAKTRAERALVFVNNAKAALERGVHREKPVKAEQEPAA